MFRDLIHPSSLEQYVAGAASASGLCVTVYGSGLRRVVSSTPRTDFGRYAECSSTPLPAENEYPGESLSSRRPPSDWTRINGLWRAVAPIIISSEALGYIAVGEFRNQTAPRAVFRRLARKNGLRETRIAEAWRTLPLLDESPLNRANYCAAWLAQALSEWCVRESKTGLVQDELSLVGHIGELLARDEDLQTILDRLVARMAEVMKCRSGSIRLYNIETTELTIAAVHGLAEDYLRKGRVLRGENPIDDMALRGEVVYVEDARRDPRVRFREEARRQGIVSGLSTGMIYRGEPIGVIRVYTDRLTRFRRVQYDLLRAVASQAASIIVNSRLITERLRDEKINRQLALAGEVQNRMMRTTPPRHPRLDVAMMYEPSFEVGGDFCDHLTLADGRWAFVVGDVVGKGVPASLLMASVRSALRAEAEFISDVGDILTRLNRHVHAETTPAEFVTLGMLAIDPRTGQAGYCSAGHEPAIRLSGRRTRLMNESRVVLGVDPNATYVETGLSLNAGEFLLLYSDGMIEAMNFRGEQFGRRRLRRSVAHYGDLSAEMILSNIRWDVRRFIGLAEQADDMTMIGLRVHGA
jgi:serine phosphatase RsbU (regulator of sigma subunit)